LSLLGIKYTKVSFFWDRSQDMNLSCFPPKAVLWLADLAGLPIRSLNFSRKHLELMSWIQISEKLPLVLYIIYIPLFSEQAQSGRRCALYFFLKVLGFLVLLVVFGSFITWLPFPVWGNSCQRHTCFGDWRQQNWWHHWGVLGNCFFLRHIYLL